MMNDAPTPSARQFCLELRRAPAGQAPRWFALSGAALGVAAYLASAAPACAHDTHPKAAPAAAHAKSSASASAALPVSASSLPVLAPLADPAVLLPIVEQSQAASADATKPASSSSPGAATPGAATPSSSEPATAEPAPPAEAAPAAEACEGECPAKRKSEISLLPELILRNLEEVPLLALVMMPVTEGVTITPAEGLPAVTFAVKPTKITRGSGLVAVGTF